jgi:hypothetical protein
MLFVLIGEPDRVCMLPSWKLIFSIILYFMLSNTHLYSFAFSADDVSLYNEGAGLTEGE